MALVPLNPPAAEAFARPAAWSGPAALKYWHLASLDAPSVAAAWACALAWAARVRVSQAMIVVLALVVWAIYLVDRLLDAWTGLRDAGRHNLQERHWFHWRHRRLFTVLAATATVAAGCMVLSRLHAAALRRDSLIGLATLAYFSGVHGGRSPRWMDWLRGRIGGVSREFVVGVIFSAGCVLPVLPSAPTGLTKMCALLVLPAAAFAMLAWLNVKAIGRWEEWAQLPGSESGVKRIALRLALACGLCGLGLGALQPRPALLLALVAVSALLLAWLDTLRDRMDAVTLRAAADLVLLTPLALLPIELMR
ncbi:hypothetical protein [Occallatibacter riparius]|uniref:Uncharacterized protein n=1 Tax=Occallatibacter riparius TaxID=1002689 RepID=A0A9J7BYY3_9BACT|nr:hypothetical protein [Occallatibacter riparius]UWZ86686.1 hypothetical protein MOP44_12240 [Occallatibacter riparius]